MSWTVGNTYQDTYGTANPHQFSFTCQSGTRVLVLWVFNNDAERTGGDPTYNGIAFLDSGSGYVIHTECGITVWYYINPPTGTSYTINVPNTGGSNIQVCVAGFIPSAGGCAKGVNNSATGLTQNPSLTLTSVQANSLIVGGLASGDRDLPTAGTNYTLIHTYDAGNQTWGNERWLDSGTTGNKTVDFGTARADDWGLIGLSFYEVSSTAWTKTISNTVQVADTLTKVLNKVKTLTNSIQVADTLTKVLNKIKTLTNTVQVSDTLTNLRNLYKTLTNTVNIADFMEAIKGGAAKVVDLFDTIQVSDTLTNLRSLFRTFTNTIQASDTVTTARNIFKSLSNTINISDLVATARDIFRTLTNTTNISDSISNSIGRFKILTSTVNIADTLETVLVKIVNIANTVNISDSISRIIGRFKTLTNSIKIIDISNHVVVNIDHETGDLSEYTGTVEDDGDLSVTEAAALAGTGWGLSCLIDDTTAIYGQYSLGSPNTSGVVRARFYIDPNALTMATNDRFNIYALFNSSALVVAIVQLLYADSSYKIRGTIYHDDSSNTNTADYAITDDTHYIELNLIRATTFESSDGSLQLWIDGVSKETISGIDNYDRFVDFSYSRIGPLGLIDYPTTNGTFYLDEQIVNDDGSEIGAYGSAHVSLSTVRNIFRNISNTINISDVLTNLRNIVRNISNSVNVSDTISKSIGRFKTLTSTVNISDTIDRLLVKVVLLADTINISDTISRIINRFKVLSDTVQASDTLTNLRNLYRSISNTIQASDLVTNARGLYKTIANTINISDIIDAVKLGAEKFVNLADDINISDSLSRIINRFKVLSETVQASDLIVNTRNIFRNISNTIQASDTILTARNIYRNLTENINISSVFSKIKGIYKTLSNNINISDEIFSLKIIIILISNIVNVSSNIVTLVEEFVKKSITKFKVSLSGRFSKKEDFTGEVDKDEHFRG